MVSETQQFCVAIRTVYFETFVSFDDRLYDNHQSQTCF